MLGTHEKPSEFECLEPWGWTGKRQGISEAYWLPVELQVMSETLPQRNKVESDRTGHWAASFGFHVRMTHTHLHVCVHLSTPKEVRGFGLNLGLYTMNLDLASWGFCFLMGKGK